MKCNIRHIHPGLRLLGLAALLLAAACTGGRPELTNPYEGVDWELFDHHRAALHVHTTQSDGYHHVADVVRAYQEAGFSILALTDHDYMRPNRRMRGDQVPDGALTAYPEEAPENFPANTTWPWADYGAPSPESLGMVGIEGSELSTRHHMNSFFTSYGVAGRREAPSDDEQLRQVGESGGLVILDHPGHGGSWWTRRPLEWYVERYQTHSRDVLIGMEITNGGYYDYNVGLWDQLLAKLMPDRPVWGFGNDDMHRLGRWRRTLTIFPLEELSSDSVRRAMLDGQFYFVRAEGLADLREGPAAYENAFPRLTGVHVDEAAGTITISAESYDEIRWITDPPSAEPIDDYTTSSKPWPMGEVIHRGESFAYRESDRLGSFLRVEIIRHDEEGPARLFLNPFGVKR